MPEVKGVSKETIVKVQLNTGKVIEAQRSASEIAEDINNWNTMVCIWEWDFICYNCVELEPVSKEIDYDRVKKILDTKKK